MRKLTIDLEDWFQVYNFSRIVKFKDWEKYESRITNNTNKILHLLNKHNTRATFFILGWIADTYPSLIKTIKQQGHEIACHGYNHKPIYLMTKEQFADDIDKAVKAIKKACGTTPVGYRAPSFSITRKTLWALDILREKGFKYDSSMMPTKHPDYGIQNIPKKPFRIRGITEFPLTTICKLPIGGGYFRAYPYMLTKLLLKQKKNAIFYIHPWELDPNLPRYNLPLLKRIRHYINLRTTKRKLNKLLKDFRFKPLTLQI